MCQVHKSSSHEQMQAEEIICRIVESILDTKLERNKKIFLSDNPYTFIQPDFYSEKYNVIGEIFAHIGKPKKSQNNKISNDVLKMLLLEKIQKKTYRKIIVVCDTEEEKTLTGQSVLAESIRQFDVEIMRVELDSEMRDRIIAAQERQKR